MIFDRKLGLNFFSGVLYIHFFLLTLVHLSYLHDLPLLAF